MPHLRRWAGAAADPGAHLAPAERLRHVEVRAGDGRCQPGAPLRHPDDGAALQHRAGTAAVGLQRLLRRLPDLQPALPARRFAGRLRGRPGGPRLRQHPRRRRRQRAGAQRRTGGRPGLQRRRRYAVHDARVRRGGPRAVRIGAAGPRERGVPLRRHPAHHLRRRRARGARLEAAAHPRGLGRGVRRLAAGDAGPGPGPGRSGREDADVGRGTPGRRGQGDRTGRDG